MECWGGATFDVAMRFLREDPWARLTQLRARVPNILFQMLLRASNAVGYTNYPDNVVKYFVQQAAKNGVDVFRVFDSLNWVENMRVAMDAVLESGAVLEGAICYTGDIFDAARPKYSLKYYVNLAKELEKAGAHVLGIKDMAGVCRPRAARELVRALKQEIGLPIHFHTHDTSGISAASVLAAVDAGIDAVDGALDSMSGLTSQPNLGAMAAAVAGSERDSGLNLDHLQELSHYWEGVRRYYAPFEADMRSGTQGVYRHEMPGGQFTNLREQARAIGLEHRWPQVERAYAEVNLLFGDIVKVTPTSKVVGDMALYMVSHGLTAEEVADPNKEVAFPNSVVSLFKGEIGFPADGFPEAMTKKVLKGGKPMEGRAGKYMPAVDQEAKRAEVATAIKGKVSDTDLASALMYPKEFREFAEHRTAFGDVSVIPTPVFFNGLRVGEEVALEIDRGKTLVLRLQGLSEPDEEGYCRMFYELNGQARPVRVPKAGIAGAVSKHPKIDEKNPNHVGAPMPGTIVTLAVQVGQRVAKGEPLVSLEAMKMETMLHADREAVVKQVLVKPGDRVAAKDLLIELG
jgi:pyruvate carboxylase